MNPKVKIKIAIDVAMSILFLLLMNTAWTGILIHEWIGIGIVALFTAHLIVNRQWIASMFRKFREITNKRTKGLFYLNLALTVSMAVTLISGILISEFLFPQLAAQNIGLWLNIHSASSWLTLIIVLAHAIVHWRWIVSVIRRIVPQHSLKVLAARATIGVFAVVAAYSLLTNNAVDLLLPTSTTDRTTGTTEPAAAAANQSTAASASGTTISQGTSDDEDVVIQPSETTAAAENAVSLSDYLGKLICTACHRRCPLTSPRCGRGVAQAEQATQEYYNTQGVEAADGV